VPAVPPRYEFPCRDGHGARTARSTSPICVPATRFPWQPSRWRQAATWQASMRAPIRGAACGGRPPGIESTLVNNHRLRRARKNEQRAARCALRHEALETSRSIACARFRGRAPSYSAREHWSAATRPSTSQIRALRRNDAVHRATLLANLAWVVFEPNDEPLGISIRTAIENFMLFAVQSGRAAGLEAERRLPGEVRPQHDDPAGHRQRHREHHRGVRAAQAGRSSSSSRSRNSPDRPRPHRARHGASRSRSTINRFDPYKR